MSDKFVHLHLHTKYSLMDAMINSEELADVLSEQGVTACAITEHGVLMNTPEAYTNLKKKGIKLIIGYEAYVARRSLHMKQAPIDRSGDHLIILAKNEMGYQNLKKLASIANGQGMYYKPRIDRELLHQYREGLIVLSGCIGGSVNKSLLDGKYEEAKEDALNYLSIMGEGNYYLEIQRHGLEEQERINPDIIRLSKETGIPIVCTNDTHYIRKDDFKTHDVLIAMQDKKLVDDPNRRHYGSDQFYLKSPEEMEELFSDIPEAVSNTVVIAEQCNVEMEFGNDKIPPFDLPRGYEGTNFDFLKDIVFEGLEFKYGRLTDEIIERANYELETIKNMKFVNYFLITWDFFRFCKFGTKNIEDVPKDDWVPIITGPGRGSGAGSIVLYATDVTKIDPIKYDLLFERFLDPSRISMPDIDSDIESERREELINYVVEKYGVKNVSQIVTFSNLTAKAVIREVSSAYGLKPFQINKISAMIPKIPGVTLQETLNSNPDFKKLYDEDGKIKEIIDVSLRLEGLPRHTSVHAAGVLITDRKGVDFHVPTMIKDGVVVSQFDKDWLEAIGLLKMDFLGLKCLSIMNATKKSIKERKNIDIDFDELYKVEDQAPFQIIREGKTEAGIFQLEGSGMSSFMTRLKPEGIEDLIAGISLYRPGPMAEIPNFLANKRNSSNIIYPIKGLEKILSPTYGVLTYQEQCMKVVVDIAGYDKRESDGFRKVIAKKKKKLIPLHRKWFIYGRELKDVDEKGQMVEYKTKIPGGVAMGHSEKELNKFFDIMEKFGEYSFNKSHGAAYGVVGYVTAYLTYYFTVDFICSALNYALTDDKVFKYINTARKYFNLELHPVSINKSKAGFSPISDADFICALKVKNSSSSTIDKIIEFRDKGGFYTSIYDFIARTIGFLDKSTFKSLIAAGAFDEFGVNRAKYLVNLETYWDKIIKYCKKKNMSYNETITTIKEREESILLDISDFDDITILNLEKFYTGVFVTGNPLESYAYTVETTSNLKIEDLFEEDERGEYCKIHDNMYFKMICFVDSISERTTKKKDLMANISIYDMTGLYQAVIFPKDYIGIKPIIKENEVFLIEGNIRVEDGQGPNLIVKEVSNIDSQVSERIIVNVKSENEVIRIINLVKENRYLRGNTPTYVRFKNSRILLKKEYWINRHYFEKEENIEILKW